MTKKPVTVAHDKEPEDIETKLAILAHEPDPVVETLVGPDPVVHKKPHKPVALARIGDTVDFYTKNAAYQFQGTEGPYAAIVVRVNDGSVDLHVFSSGDAQNPSFHQINVTDKADSESWFKAR